ncbi:MAG: ATP-binding domain-containing protein, partial [Fibrobacter sp.]|nr:ATP-binding domain-containing protein [Fibrobacter sp.]
SHPGDSREPPIADTIVTLRKSYRFSENSAIGTLSRAIRDGQPAEAKRILRSSNTDECLWENLPSQPAIKDYLRKIVQTYYLPLYQTGNPQDALSYFDRFRILCASRQGPYGVESINRQIISILISMGIISSGETHYKGLPLMITGNDYGLNLYNGDTGLLFPDNESRGLKAIFNAPDGTLKKYIPRQISAWETAYAMTVHKSQGSEFDHILLILPPIQNPVLTRELLYTAVTRARKKVILWSTEPILEHTISSKTTRSSGLRKLLWGAC